MATITANIDDETDALFRDAVKTTLGEGKGKLGKAIDEALIKWTKEKTQEKQRLEVVALLQTGFYKVSSFKREDLYDR